jgi:hypothetical protein
MYMYIGRLQDTSLFASFRSVIPVLLVLNVVIILRSTRLPFEVFYAPSINSRGAY